jgi:hypothetical protein
LCNTAILLFLRPVESNFTTLLQVESLLIMELLLCLTWRQVSQSTIQLIFVSALFLHLFLYLYLLLVPGRPWGVPNVPRVYNYGGWDQNHDPNYSRGGYDPNKDQRGRYQSGGRGGAGGGPRGPGGPRKEYRKYSK